MVKALKEALDDEKFLVASIKGPLDLLDLLEEAFGDDGEDMEATFYQQITPERLKRGLMAIPEMVVTNDDVTTGLFYSDGSVNEAFAIDKKPRTADTIVSELNKIFDGSKPGLEGLSEVRDDSKDQLKQEIRQSIREAGFTRENQGRTEEENKIERIQIILDNYLVRYNRGDKFQKAKYEDIITREVYEVKPIPGLAVETFNDDKKALSDSLRGNSKRTSFNEFFDMFKRKRKSKRSQVKSPVKILDTVLITLDLGKASKRGDIYDFWEEYVKDNKDRWEKLVEMFDGGDMYDLMQNLKKISKRKNMDKDVAAEMQEMVDAFDSAAKKFKSNSMPVIRLTPARFSSNPSMIQFQIITDYFKVLNKDTKLKYGEEFTTIPNEEDASEVTAVGASVTREVDGEQVTENLDYFEEPEQQLGSDPSYSQDGSAAIVATYEEAPEGISQDREKLSVGLENVENLRQSMVDPLFYHLATTDIKFKNVAATRRQVRTIEKKLMRFKRSVQSDMEHYDIKDSDLENMLNSIGEIKEDAADESRNEYFLPLSEDVLLNFSKSKLFAAIEEGNDSRFYSSYVDANNALDAIKEFCNLLMKAVKIGRNTIQEYTEFVTEDTGSGTGAGRTRSGGKKGTMLTAGSRISRRFKGRGQEPSPYLQENIDEVYQQIQDVFTELLKLIDATLLEPFDGEYMPFKPKNPFFSANDVKVLRADIQSIIKEVGGIEQSAEMYIADRLSEGDTLVTKKSIKRMMEFLAEITKLRGLEKKDVLNKTNSLYRVMNNVFDSRYDELNKIYLGAFLHELEEKYDLGLEEFQGERLSDLYGTYNSMKATKWPIPQFVKLVKDKEKMFLEDGFLKDDIKQLTQLLGKIDAQIRKTDIELAFLQAHDVIRKKLNKQVYYANGDINDPDDVYEINKMIHEKHRVDLSASEIIKIDRDFGAFKDIGKENGVSEEVVYMIKANFR